MNTINSPRIFVYGLRSEVMKHFGREIRLCTMTHITSVTQLYGLKDNFYVIPVGKWWLLPDFEYFFEAVHVRGGKRFTTFDGARGNKLNTGLIV